MSQIRDKQTELLEHAASQALRDRAHADDALAQLFKDITKDKGRVSELIRVDVQALTQSGRETLQRFVAEQLKGQLPPEIAYALLGGKAPPEVMQKLLQRVANTHDPSGSQRFGQAPSAEAARLLATDQAVPQQALRWAQFVQRVTHVPGSQLHDRAGSATPKGEVASLLEMLGKSGGVTSGPGLRSPRLVERNMGELSPAQRATLLRSTFGEKLARALEQLGIKDPLQFVRAGALPSDRGELARALDMPRAQLLGLLMRAELLKIGPGRNGELGIRPELLGALQHSGIAMLGTLSALRAVSPRELAHIYQNLRAASRGFATTGKKSRPIVKRDLLHWAKSAARKPSDILLADREQLGSTLSRGDAQELVQAWVLENLFWNELAEARRRQQQEAQRDERERKRRRGEGDGTDGDEAGAEDGRDEHGEWADELPELEFDEERGDRLMCFWITDFNPHSAVAGVVKQMYVCIDPDTGAILPQSVEAEVVSIG